MNTPRTILSSLTFVPLLVALLLMTTCTGRAGEICDLVCSCTECNDRDEDLCVINENAELDRAAAYGCTEEYDTYLDCVLSESDCNDGMFEIDANCIEDHTAYYECVEDASDLGG